MGRVINSVPITRHILDGCYLLFSFIVIESSLQVGTNIELSS